jgi:hypothetical protein
LERKGKRKKEKEKENGKERKRRSKERKENIEIWDISLRVRNRQIKKGKSPVFSQFKPCLSQRDAPCLLRVSVLLTLS